MPGSYESWSATRKVCVIGAGTMGGGIAAHLANLGFEVSLLDLTAESAKAAFERARAAKPPHFYLPETAEQIRIGGTDSDLRFVREADWVCEAIIEKPDAKRRMFQLIEPLLKPDAMISTNTSGLQISLLSQGLSESFHRRFMGTHFFNPPRYLKLLELIPTLDTDPAAVSAMLEFLESRVARRVVTAKDTPGFIANRFGMWSMMHAIHVAERLQLSIEEVDAITGPFLGRPKSGSFRLNDIVGLDIMADIAKNLLERCPHDPVLASLEMPRSMGELIKRGDIGEKVGKGYYKREGKEFWALDLGSLSFRPRHDPKLPSLSELEKLPLRERIASAFVLEGRVGEFLREYLGPALRYADSIKEEISHSVLDFDRVMKWGFGWELGPFETIDAIGHDRLSIAEGPFYSDGNLRSFAGTYVSIPKEPQYAKLSDFDVIDEKESFRLRDMGDSVIAVCVRTKMGIVTPKLISELGELLDAGRLGPLVLTSEAKSFSAGFDLKYFADCIDKGDFEAIRVELANLQSLTVKLGRFPSVAAVFGHALGAGLELALGCRRIVAAAESKIGFPEAKVGVLPGGGGAARTRVIAQTGGARVLAETAIALTQGYVAQSADEARNRCYIRAEDSTVYLEDRLLWVAKQEALRLSGAGFQPAASEPEWRLVEGPLVGMIDQMQNEIKARGELTDHDELIGDKIKAVYAKSKSFSEALEKERTGFVDLCRTGLTHARIKHMLDVGKPLRN